MISFISRFILFCIRVHAVLVKMATVEQIKRMKGVQISKTVKISGSPIIDIRNGARIIIHDNVTLNSKNHGYHINMHSPVKLYADRAGAEIEIGANTRIHGSCIHAYEKIVIGESCLIAANCHIIDGNGHELCLDNPSNRINSTGGSSPVIIKDNVWVGANVIILPGVTIGEGSVIAAGSIVTKDVPPYSVVGGNPTRVLKQVDEKIVHVSQELVG